MKIFKISLLFLGAACMIFALGCATTKTPEQALKSGETQEFVTPSGEKFLLPADRYKVTYNDGRKKYLDDTGGNIGIWVFRVTGDEEVRSAHQMFENNYTERWSFTKEAEEKKEKTLPQFSDSVAKTVKYRYIINGHLRYVIRIYIPELDTMAVFTQTGGGVASSKIEEMSRMFLKTLS